MRFHEVGKVHNSLGDILSRAALDWHRTEVGHEYLEWNVAGDISNSDGREAHLVAEDFRIRVAQDQTIMFGGDFDPSGRRGVRARYIS